MKHRIAVWSVWAAGVGGSLAAWYALVYWIVTTATGGPY